MLKGLLADVLAPLALMLASPFFFASAIKERRRRLFFHSQGISAEGVVIRVDEEKGIDDEFTSHVPKIGYMAIGQQWVTVPYGNSALKTGDVVPILYNPMDYKDFIVSTDNELWLELLFGIVGMTMLVSSLVWLSNLIKG